VSAKAAAKAPVPEGPVPVTAKVARKSGHRDQEERDSLPKGMVSRLPYS